MSRLKLAASAILSLAIASPASATTTFFDDWEDVNFAGPGFIVLPSYSGWNATAGPGIEIQYDNVAGQAFSGQNLVELDSYGNSQMTYGVPLDAGNYTLSFWYSNRPNVAAASNGIDVLLNATSILSVAGGNGGPTTNWVLQTVNFTANAGDTLSFAALGVSDSLGGYIDDLRLTAAVPEPATWALMILGFGAIGGALRSSRRRLTAMPA